MTTNEQKLIDLLKTKHIDVVKAERNSDREYDLKIEGVYSEKSTYMAGISYSAWLPLLAIRELTDWTSKNIASHTDYPDMCEQGDWSGMRDSSKEAIWTIFEKYVSKG